MVRNAAALLLAVIAAPAFGQPVEIRFCPDGVARPYPLDSLRGIQGLLIQNIALLAPAEGTRIDAVEIELMRSGEAVDTRRIAGAALDGAARSGQALQAQGVMALVPFQFCDGRLLGEARLAEGATLGAGQALLVSQQVFAWRGARDALRVTVRATQNGQAQNASAELRLDPTPSRTVLRWPLRGGPWMLGAGASFHTTHRWAVPEEFALDIVKVGADGRSHRGEGAAHADFLGYGAEVVAAADGTVVHVVTGSREDPPLLRRPGETLEGYYGRISERQAVNLQAGEAGFIGDSVVIDHGQSEFSVYAHLVPGSIAVRQGEAVRAGQAIGRLGSSGNSTEPHLHFQLCDRASAISCAGLIPNFEGIALPMADGPRPLQSGDLVIAAD